MAGIDAMSSRLMHPSGRGFWTSRGLASMAILVIHGMAAGITVLAKSTPEAEPHADPVLVTLLTERRAEPVPTPGIPLREVRPPTPVAPIVSIDLDDEPAPAPSPIANTTLAAAAETGDANAPIIASTVEYIRPPAVVYPLAAKRAHATGTVQVRALVETDGQVREAQVHRSSGNALLDRAACDSVRGALFRPYMVDGAARAALVIVPIDFSLKIRTASR